jgi:hypothetical protein
MPVWSGALMSKLPRASATKLMSADSSPSSAAVYGLAALPLVRGSRDFPGSRGLHSFTFLLNLSRV